VALKPHTVGRGAGRPPADGETATHHVHIRTTAKRKSAWVRAARPRTLAQWATENLDKAAHYEPVEQDWSGASNRVSRGGQLNAGHSAHDRVVEKDR